MELEIAHVNFRSKLALPEVLTEVQIIDTEYFLVWLAGLLLNLLSVFTLDVNGKFDHSWVESVGLAILVESHILLENMEWLVILAFDLANSILKAEF